MKEKRAQDILEKIKQKKLSAVVKKIPEEINLPLPPQAPVIEKEKQRKSKPKKLEKDVLILEEEAEKVLVELPEGGPRLEEPGIEDQAKPVLEEEIEVIAKPRKRSTKKSN